jgi:tetratricopeptide (TPR) repeat protein
MTCGRYIFTLVALVLTASTASAQDVDTRTRAARTACLAGDYAKGVALLSELFVATEDPGFIYNQGRCFEQNHRYEDAIARFQEYLRVAKRLSKSEKFEAQKHISSCQNLLAQQDGSKPTTGGQSSVESKEAKERAARKACLLGNVDKGSEILGDLYLEGKDPTHIYNLGRCYEQNHRYEDAVSRFREYIIKNTNLTEAERNDTEKHIASCLKYLGKSEVPQPPQPTSEHPPVQHANGQPSGGGQVALTASDTSGQSGQNANSDEMLSAPLAERPSTKPGKHTRQLGLFFQFERVLVPGVSYGIAGGLEIEVGALIGYYKGTLLSLRYLFLDGAIKPGLALGMPVFIVGGKAMAGIQGGAAVQWDYTRHVGIYASLAVAYFPGAASDLGSFWFLPGIGAQVRL